MQQLSGWFRGKRAQWKHGCRLAARNWDCYLFILPFFLIFAVFVIAPVFMALYYSFTYFNVLQDPKWIGWQNYVELFTGDEIFIKSVKNTFLIALVTGPFGYLASFLLAWSINELKPALRALMVTIMYAPSISGGAYMIWTIIFSGDEHGYINSLLMSTGLVTSPIQFFTDTNWMIWVCILVMLWMGLGAGFLAFVAGFQTVDKSYYEAGYVEGVQNRWQELWHITLPIMKPQLLFGAVMSITAAFSCGSVSSALFGQPSTDYAVHTALNHMTDYGGVRYDMGYACAIATLLFLVMIGCNELIQRTLSKIGE